MANAARAEIVEVHFGAVTTSVDPIFFLATGEDISDIGESFGGKFSYDTTALVDPLAPYPPQAFYTGAVSSLEFELHGHTYTLSDPLPSLDPTFALFANTVMLDDTSDSKMTVSAVVTPSPPFAGFQTNPFMVSLRLRDGPNNGGQLFDPMPLFEEYLGPNDVEIIVIGGPDYIALLNADLTLFGAPHAVPVMGATIGLILVSVVSSSWRVLRDRQIRLQ